jgi:hypothetical protein
MAAAFIFPNRKVFSLGNHGFYPIVDRIRAAASADESRIIESIVRPTDEGFDFLTLDEEIAPQAFRAFYRIASREYARCAESNEAAKVHPDYYDRIMAAWSELLRRMRTDSRCGPLAAD